MKLSITFISLTLMIASCGPGDSNGDFQDTIALNDNKADLTIDINDATDMSVSAIGILDLRIVDSTLIISTQADRGIWQLYRLPKCDSITSILDIGGGPCETMAPVPLLYTSITTDTAGHHLINFFERASGKLMSIDITGITDNPLNNAIHEEYGQPVSTMDIYSFKMNNGNIYTVSLDMENGRLKRSILHDGTDITPEAILHINNKYHVDDISLINEIASYPLISPDSRYVADIKSSGGINLFDLKNENAVSLLFDQDSDSDIQIIPGHAYDNFFTITRTSRKENFTRLDFIGWDGSMHRTIEINSPELQSIDVDMNTGTLYAVDPDNDRIIALPTPHPAESWKGGILPP